MNFRIAIAALVMLTAAPALAIAEGNSSGVYVGGGWGRFDLQLHSLADAGAAADSITDSKDNAWKVFAGYRFSPNWSLEGAYIDFGKAGDQFVASGSQGSYTVKMHGFAPSLIGTIPLGPVELFGKVGYYFYNTETSVNLSSGTFLQASHSRSDFLYGAGVGFTFIEHLNVRAEYERIHVQNAPNSDALWLAAAWRF